MSGAAELPRKSNRFSRIGLAHAERLHIVGSPRSGTTLLAEMMATCFRFDAHAPHEMSIFKRPEREVGLFCSKNPQDVLVARPLLAIDPNLWLIYVIRDPRDVTVSRHGKAPDRYWANLRIWKQYHRAGRRLMGHPRCMAARYGSRARSRRRPGQADGEVSVLERLHAFSDFHETARPSEGSLKALRGVRPVSGDSIGAWRRHKPRVAAQLGMHGPISGELAALGYEPDDRWLAELSGVMPDNQQSFLNEKTTMKFRHKVVVHRATGYLRYLFGLHKRAPVCRHED